MMEASLSGVLQQALLKTHMRKQQKKSPDFSSPSPTSKICSFSSSSSSSSSILLNDQDSDAPFSCGDGGESSSSPSPSFFCDPVLQYISDILDEEDMEDRKCMMQECISYQATVEEFYEILRGKDEETSCGDFHSAENGFLPPDKYDDDDDIKGKFTADEYGMFCINGKDQFPFCVDERQVELELSGEKTKKKEDEEHWMEDLLKSIGEDTDGDKDETREFPIPDSFYSSSNSLLLSCENDGKTQSIEGVYANGNPNRRHGNGKPHELCPPVSDTMAMDISDIVMEPFPELSPSGFSKILNRVDNVPKPSKENHIWSCGSKLHDGSNAFAKPFDEVLYHGFPKLQDGSDTIKEPLDKVSHSNFPYPRNGSDSIKKPFEELAQHSFPEACDGYNVIKKSLCNIGPDGFPKLNDESIVKKKPLGKIPQSDFPYPPNGSATIGKHFEQRNIKRPKETGVQGHQWPTRGHINGNFDEKKGPKQDEIVSYVRNGDLDAEICGKVLTNGFSSISNHGMSIRQEQDRGCSPCQSTTNLKSLLMQAAMASDNIGKANLILQEIRRHSSPYGNGLQRLAHYFAEGLVARLSGTGGLLYTAFTNNAPSAARMLKAHHLFVEVCPLVKLSHYFANKAILEATRGASKIHIIDYGILYGLQWPCLISALAERKGEPLPLLRITGIDFPRPGVKAAERVEMTGRRLAEYAKAYDVPFEYHAIANKWENIQASDLRLHKDEVLVVNSMFRLRHLLDETVLASNPRKTVLHRIRSLNPKMFVQGVRNGSFNTPFFMSRFKEALSYFECEFDMIDSTIGLENQERMMMEREVLGRDILNVVACEGVERIERPETYGQWQNRTRRAGFEQVALDENMLQEAKVIVKSMYDKEFSVSEDGHWMLIGWKGQPLHALSLWRPTIIR